MLLLSLGCRQRGERRQQSCDDEQSDVLSVFAQKSESILIGETQASTARHVENVPDVLENLLREICRQFETAVALAKHGLFPLFQTAVTLVLRWINYMLSNSEHICILESGTGFHVSMNSPANRLCHHPFQGEERAHLTTTHYRRATRSASHYEQLTAAWYTLRDST